MPLPTEQQWVEVKARIERLLTAKANEDRTTAVATADAAAVATEQAILDQKKVIAAQSQADQAKAEATFAAAQVALTDYLVRLGDPITSVVFHPGQPIPRKESIMAKLSVKLFKKSALAPHKGAPAAKPVKDVSAGLSYLDSENGTGLWGGLDAAGQPAPLDPAIWSQTLKGIAPDKTVVSDVTVSGLSDTFVGTGAVGNVTVTFTLHTADGSYPDTDFDVPVEVKIGPAKTPIFIPGTPVAR